MAQVDENLKRYIRIGNLQSHFSAYGSERAWNNDYYEGLQWPALYPQQDNAVIKRAWMGVEDFTDESGYNWGHYSLYVAQDATGIAVFPMELTQSAKFENPIVYVDGTDINAVFANQIDYIDEAQVADRIVSNVINTSMGLTQKRDIYAFSQEYHDDYFIKVYTFTNTGNTDWDDDIELNAPLKGVRVGWGTRYSLGREAAYIIGYEQSYGAHSWVSRRGEDYIDHQNDLITEANSVADWLRAGFSWMGQSETNDYNNIGAPDVKRDGRLTSPNHAGSVVLHVDKSSTDAADDAFQPTFLGWHAGDRYPKVEDLRSYNEPEMFQVYEMLRGIPFGDGSGGQTRMETLAADPDSYDPWHLHNDGGGTNVMITYGPFDLAPGESIVIVEAEGINGLDRDMCELIGQRWKKAYDNSSDSGPFDLPDASTTTDKDIYKNQWVYTGRDSILKTFGRAKRNYESGFGISSPPQPPPLFNVKSGGDRITLEWNASPSESDPNFGGYRIFRAIGKKDTTYKEIFACGFGAENDIRYSFSDISAVRGQAYYYYISSFTDGSGNQNDLNPTGILQSGRFYTLTTKPAYLQREAVNIYTKGDFPRIRIVPNPYNIRGNGFTGEKNKIMFYDIPGKCTIRIFSERGDLIKTIEHDDGSGDQEWYLTTDTRQTIVSGVYVAHFTDDKGQMAYEKFIVIR